MGYLSKFSVKRFKSLADFALFFAPAGRPTCLVGLNGAGKSTVLHALDFSGQLFRGDIQNWLKVRNWKKTDVLSRPLSHRSLEIELSGIFNDHQITWRGNYNTSLLRCTEERFEDEGKELFSVREKKLYTLDTKCSDIIFEYEGSILSQIHKSALLNNARIQEFYHFMSNLHSFDMLNPKQLRTRGRKFQSTNIGMGGEHLSGLLASMSREQVTKIIGTLHRIFPWIESIRSKSLRAGWQELSLQEAALGSIDAQHSSDGVMRVLALITEIYSSDSCIMFDEIENGFNPAVIHAILQLLEGASSQILITTHNPLILNALSEKQLEKGVVLLYKQNNQTKALPFFEIPAAKERLEYMHAGEVFLDIDIEATVENLH